MNHDREVSMFFLLFTLLWLTLLCPVQSAQRPNILWITAEDISPNLGCYGDTNALTPNLDRFAKDAVRFRSFFSIHPCCSPSRSALVTGVYPTRLGTFQHRAKMWVDPELVKCFPTLLRRNGYYTFNGSSGGTAKLDYNFDPKDQPWDKVGSTAIEWRNRTNGQPFFGQINLNCTHQSQYGKRPPGGDTPGPAPTPVPSEGKRKKKKKQQGKGEGAGRSALVRVHSPDKIHIPPYHPDTPAVREIWVEYHDRITQMDGQFDGLLKQLAEDELAENTIVFFFGDNGHGIPGGKVWLWDQGVHVPLIIRFPKNWAHLAPGQPGSVSDRLVSFIDFAPSVLSLAGAPIPDYMQGAAFLGSHAGKPRQHLFAARDFHDGADFDASRMVRDERFHYIRNLMPHLGWDPIQYSWKQAPFMLEEWRQAAHAGKLKPGTRNAAFFSRSKPMEELYDVSADPWQMHNLATDPAHRKTLEDMRGLCKAWMLENHDLGLLSQFELYSRAEIDSPYVMAADPARNPTRKLIDIANLANQRDPENLPQLIELLKAGDSAIRRWAAIGLLALPPAKHTPQSQQALRAALDDSSPDVRLTAAEALCSMSQTSAAVPVLAALLQHESRIIRNQTLLAICRIGPAAKDILPHLDKALGPSKHQGIWSYDNLIDMVPLARSCITGDGSQWLTREKTPP